MDLRNKLSQRIGVAGIKEVISLVRNDPQKRHELYEYLFDTDDLIGYQTAWVMTHFSSNETVWLHDKQDELIDGLLNCGHPGKRRLLLTILSRQPVKQPIRIDFLDYCLERMVSKKELPAVQNLCIKLAYELCRLEPELLQELKAMLEMMEHDMAISTYATRKNILKAITKGEKKQFDFPKSNETNSQKIRYSKHRD